MRLSSRNQRGFSAIEILAGFIAVIIIGSAGYLVAEHRHPQTVNLHTTAAAHQAAPTVSKTTEHTAPPTTTSQPTALSPTSPTPTSTATPTAPAASTPAPNQTLNSWTSCTNPTSSDPGVAATTYAEVTADIVGQWTGCVTTPWVNPYEISITFHADGTYSAKQMSSAPLPALYYGTDTDNPAKTYSIDNLQSNGTATGTMVIYFASNTTTTDSLSTITVTANTLQFELMHLGRYGPLKFDLVRLQ